MTLRRVLVPLWAMLLLCNICYSEDKLVTLSNNTGLAQFSDDKSATDILNVKSETDPITVSDAKRVYGDNGSTCTGNRGARGDVNQVVKAADVTLRKGASLYKAWGTYNPAGGGGGVTILPQWDAQYLRQILPIYYLGGTSSTDGTQEGEKELANNYILKGYVLKCVFRSAPQGTQVTWAFKKGGQEVGTFHNGHAWTDYGTTIAKGTGATIYWRSDTAGAIGDQYTVEATYTLPTPD